MSILVGANWPEDPTNRDAPPETWRIFDIMQPKQVRVKSNISENDVRRLAQSYPGMLWHIKMKGNLKWFPQYVTDKEYSNEFSPVELIRLLISLGIHPVLELLNEVDVELTPEWQADNQIIKDMAIHNYCLWAHRQIDILGQLFGVAGPDTFHVALSSLSEGGPPERFNDWWAGYNSFELLSRVTRVVDHCYYPDFKYNDTAWGSRFLLMRNDWAGPIDITETNDNGSLSEIDRVEAAEDYLEYIHHRGGVDSVSYFMLPGVGFDTPDWWIISRPMAMAIGDTYDEISNVTPLQPLPPTPVPSSPVLDPWEYWTAEEIASIARVPIGNVLKYWPTIHEALKAHGIGHRAVQAAAIGTIAIETASIFAPIDEFYSSYWNTYSGGANFHGRGFIQLTHDYNYRTYGQALGFDLLGNPDLAKDPFVAAMVMARYFADPRGIIDTRSVADAALNQDWEAVRRKVQGGTAALDRLTQICDALLATQSEPALSPQYVFPIRGYAGDVNLHWGTHIGGSDIFAPEGSDCIIMTDGVITFAGFDSIGGNNILMIGDDGLRYYYAHGDRLPAVVTGERVIPGQYVFGVGNTGNASTGAAHLHIGIGRSIVDGSGPTGGTGSGFDAVTFLRSLLGTVELEDDPVRVAELEGIIIELQHQLAGKTDYANSVVEAFAHTADVIVPAIVEEKRVKNRRTVAKQVYALRTARIGPKP